MSVRIAGLHEILDYTDQAIDFFADTWQSDRRLYADAMRNSPAGRLALPRWYLLLADGEIVGGCGLIANDFISRQDLMPWVCALYVAPNWRGQGWGGKLLEHARQEAGAMGYGRVFLSTDHTGYYERYGWTYMADGFHPWGASSRIYVHFTQPPVPSLQFLGNPILETERLLLRPFVRDDVEDVFRYASNPQVARYMTWDAHKTREDSFWFVDWAKAQADEDRLGQWAIVLKASGRVIGSIGFSQFDPANSWGAVGYALSEEYWSQGLGTEALKRLLVFVFADMELNRVEAMHFLDNPASGRVMEKAGMRFEGVIREKVLAKKRYWDVKQYAILRKDWLADQNK